MKKFIKTLKKKLGKCTEWKEVFQALESKISPEHILPILEILNDFLITDPEIKVIIEENLDEFLEQMKIVCFHMISTFYTDVIRDMKTTEFFTIHVKWFYVIFVYFALKKMVNQKMIDWSNFRENQNIQKIFIDALMKYEGELPVDFYDRKLRPTFRIILNYITLSPSCKLEGIGGVPDYMSDYPN